MYFQRYARNLVTGYVNPEPKEHRMIPRERGIRVWKVGGLISQEWKRCFRCEGRIFRVPGKTWKMKKRGRSRIQSSYRMRERERVCVRMCVAQRSCSFHVTMISKYARTNTRWPIHNFSCILSLPSPLSFPLGVQSFFHPLSSSFPSITLFTAAACVL